LLFIFYPDSSGLFSIFDFSKHLCKRKFKKIKNQNAKIKITEEDKIESLFFHNFTF